MKNFFTVGTNNIGYISQLFKDIFGDMDVKIPKKLKLEVKVLDKPMTDQKIFDEWQPKESTLGEFAWALKNEPRMLKNGYASIFYVRDNRNTLWAVYAGWRPRCGGWGVNVSSVAYLSGWGGGGRVLSQAFSVLGDSRNLDGSVLEINGNKYRLNKIN